MKNRILLSVFALLFTFFTTGNSLQAVMSSVQQQAISWVNKTPEKAKKDVASLAAYLGKVSEDEYTKALTVFSWVAKFIRYDHESLEKYNNDLEMSPQDAQSVLTRGNGVCAGYSDLLVALCNSAGLECKEITGYAKGAGFTPGDQFTKINHAWNAIKIYGHWQLMDACWASPKAQTGEINMYYFCASPSQLLEHHLPADSKWQLIGEKKSLADFVNTPFVWNGFHLLGFESYAPVCHTLEAKRQTVILNRAFAQEFSYQVYVKGIDGQFISLEHTERKTASGIALVFDIPQIEGTLNICGTSASGEFATLLWYGIKVLSPAVKQADAS